MSTRLTPLAEQIRSKLLKELASGRYKLNEPLPTHREWAKRYRVSTTTISRVLDSLKERHIIESAEGSYTFLRSLPEKAMLAKETARHQLPVRVSMWMHDRKDFWKMRQSILRRRFQNRFRQDHPNVVFDEQQVERRASEVDVMLAQSLLSEPDPTLAHATQTALPFFLDHGAVAPLSSLGVDGLDEHVSRLKPGAARACSRDGAVYLLPGEITYTLLFYSKPHFRDAGLDPEQPPRDWEELAHAAETITRANGGQPSLHIPGPINLVGWLTQLANQAIPRLTGDRAPNVNWTSAAAKTALDYFVDLYTKRKVIDLHIGTLTTFPARNLAGEFAMQMMEWGSIAQIAMLGRTDRFGIAALPIGPNGRTISMVNCGGWVVNAHASPDSQRASLAYALAWEHWQRFEEGGSLMAKLGVAPHLASPFSNRAADRFAARLPSDWLRTMEALDAHGLWEAPEADWGKIVVGRAIEEMLQEGQPLSTARMQELFRLRETEAGFGQLIPSLTEENQATHTIGEEIQ